MQFLLLRDLAIIFAGSLLVILVFHRLNLPALPGFIVLRHGGNAGTGELPARPPCPGRGRPGSAPSARARSEEHTSELQSRGHLVCRLLLEKKKRNFPPRLRIRP